MVHRQWQRRVFVALLPLFAVCGSHLEAQAPSAASSQPVRPQASVVAAAVSPAAAIPPAAASAEDPALTLIAASERHFQAGKRALEQGHFEAAKQEFDRAIDVLLESSYGGRTEPRIREHFDRLVDRISAYEVKALAEGDGFTEKKYEAASIDELLALSTTFEASAPGPALKGTVQADLKSNAHDIPIPLNQRVLSYIELFQGRLHDFIELGMKRGSKYLPMIQSVFRAEGLPLDLAYVPLVESAFNPNALSRAKAKGVWQFMSGTALENGLHRDWYIDERSDPEKATIAAAKYLGTLSKQFDGDWHLALASYNGGPGRLQRALKRAGLDDFWKLAERPKLLPRETREYVPMILAAMVIARNPTQYGFDIVPDEVASYEKVTLPRPVDLRRVAEWTDTSIHEIQALNPELRRWTTPVKYPKYEMKVPTGTADRLTAKLAEASPADFSAFKWYTAKKGETLLTVARRFGVSRNDVAEANNLTAKSRLRPGQELIIPRAPATLLATRTERAAPTAVASRAIAEPVQTAALTTPARVEHLTYKVKRGDTLFSIAQLFDTTVAKIKSWNRLSTNRIAPGAKLKILAARSRS
jgi:membrane-bound lytic murein transglycosylase D